MKKTYIYPTVRIAEADLEAVLGGTSGDTIEVDADATLGGTSDSGGTWGLSSKQNAFDVYDDEEEDY